ncbi:MAG: type II CRISPR RNA-guided endonuclease Cas9 [Pseudomonadota bacterium]
MMRGDHALDYRLGLDIGANSIGWAMVGLDDRGRPNRLLDAGVRIYADGRNPKDKTSLAVARRGARSMRRRRDRYLSRRRKLLRVLTEHGLLPADPAARDVLFDPRRYDPYALRALGLDEKMTCHQLGRAIFHLNQRRGFKSNRKSDKDDDKESGKIKLAVDRLRQAMKQVKARTLGEYLHTRREQRLPVRVRMRVLGTDDKGKPQEGYDFYPDRALVEEEFETLWTAQARHHGAALSDATKAAIHDFLFFQRPLRPVRAGKCTFEPQEERLPKAHPLAQRFRIYQEANNLRIIGEDKREGPPLCREDRDKVAMALLSNPKRTFNQLRTVLRLPKTASFNLESDNRKALDGDLTAAALTGTTKKPGPFAGRWSGLSLERQIEIIDRLLNEQDEDRLIAWLMADCGLSESQAQKAANLSLVDGHINLGPTATRAILAQLEKDVVVYSAACAAAGYHHSDFRTGEIFDQLPYYGKVMERHVAFGSGDPADHDDARYGRVANPTVHIGLNQLRHVANALIRRHGPPAQISVELARELKLNKRQKDAINKTIKENTNRAERHCEKLAELGYPDNGENRLRLRLWEELNPTDPHNRLCPYSLQPIAIKRLFTAEVDIDHILPFSKTLDNSAANRTVCFAAMNKRKRDFSPYEAFGHQPDWPNILAHAQSLPRNKRWRFAPDAMERFAGTRDFLDRQLVDTQYLSRIAAEYLSFVCGPDNVWASPGRLTAMLRRFWGLNSILRGHNVEDPDNPPKNRDDHRHHAIDAIVIALTDRGLLNRMAREASAAEEQNLDRLMAHAPLPWDSLREDVRAVVGRITVSHRPDHKSSGGRGRAMGRNQTSGRLHNDTAYGIINGPDARGAYEVVHRVPFDSLAKMADVMMIRDKQLRDELAQAVYGLDGDENKKLFKAALLNFAATHPVFKGIRHVRVVETLSVIPVKDRRGKIYKAYKGDANERFDVWRLAENKFVPEVVSTFDANQPGHVSPIRAHNHTAKKVLSLHKDDIIAWEDDKGATQLLRVVKFSIIGSLQLAPPNEANVDARTRDKDSNFKYINTSASGLMKRKARQVRVDELGHVFDPGPRC